MKGGRIKDLTALDLLAPGSTVSGAWGQEAGRMVFRASDTVRCAASPSSAGPARAAASLLPGACSDPSSPGAAKSGRMYFPSH